MSRTGGETTGDAEHAEHAGRGRAAREYVWAPQCETGYTHQTRETHRTPHAQMRACAGPPPATHKGARTQRTDSHSCWRRGRKSDTRTHARACPGRATVQSTACVRSTRVGDRACARARVHAKKKACVSVRAGARVPRVPGATARAPRCECNNCTSGNTLHGSQPTTHPHPPLHACEQPRLQPHDGLVPAHQASRHTYGGTKR